jgi:hypothetical protein
VRRTLEASYRTDLSGVRVHTGPSAAAAARSAGANALTVGSDIVFGRDQYDPHSSRGIGRIAHEVAHTVQQRRPTDLRDAGARRRAEREADRAAEAAAGGGRAHISMQTGGVVQLQEAGRTPTFVTDSPEFQLHLDPEIQAMMLQNYVRWWLGSSITEGEPASESEPEAEAAGAGEPTAAPSVPPPHELPPDFFQPYDPADLGVEPDVGAILSPYNVRNVPLGARDVDAATRIFQQNARFVSILPDLRAAAPGFLRPLIPGDWRTSIAEALTAATLNAQLKHDYPTPIEAADLSFYRMTGVSTTYLPIPGFSF